MHPIPELISPDLLRAQKIIALVWEAEVYSFLTKSKELNELRFTILNKTYGLAAEKAQKYLLIRLFFVELFKHVCVQSLFWWQCLINLSFLCKDLSKSQVHEKQS